MHPYKCGRLVSKKISNFFGSWLLTLYLGSNLIAALSGLKVNNLTHFRRRLNVGREKDWFGLHTRRHRQSAHAVEKMLKCGRFQKVVLFLSLLRQRLLGRCYAAKPSLDLIGWLHSIFGNFDYITNRSGVRPAQNAGLMRMRKVIQSTWLDLEVWQSTSSTCSTIQ